MSHAAARAIDYDGESPPGFKPSDGRMRRHAMRTLAGGFAVIEQGTFITGPCAGMMLADLGADVIKVESPEGDPYRAYQAGQYSPHFQAYNRNKRSLALDMKQARDCELFNGLVREADVYIQNFRPGTAGTPGGRRRAAARDSTRAWSTARSAASARAARTSTGRATTRSRRP